MIAPRIESRIDCKTEAARASASVRARTAIATAPRTAAKTRTRSRMETATSGKVPTRTTGAGSCGSGASAGPPSSLPAAESSVKKERSPSGDLDGSSHQKS